MSVTSELIDRLRRHYIKEPQPGGIFIAECGLNNSFGAQRRVDAVHIGFTRTSGRALHVPDGEPAYPGERPACIGCTEECMYCEGNHYHDECPVIRLCDQIESEARRGLTTSC